MKYWLDTEFIEDGFTIDLISIGIVAEDGCEYYAVSKDFRLDRCHDWLWENVLPYLPPFSAAEWKHRSQICDEVSKFVGGPDGLIKPKPELWAYYADYDWVALCQLFGAMIDLPKHFPMYCRDIKQWADMLGNPKLPEQGKGEHNALLDAQWNKKAWEFLNTYQA